MSSVFTSKLITARNNAAAELTEIEEESEGLGVSKDFSLEKVGSKDEINHMRNTEHKGTNQLREFCTRLITPTCSSEEGEKAAGENSCFELKKGVIRMSSTSTYYYNYSDAALVRWFRLNEMVPKIRTDVHISHDSC